VFQRIRAAERGTTICISLKVQW